MSPARSDGYSGRSAALSASTKECSVMLKTHTCGELNAEHVGKQVTLAGWVNRRRDHGGLIFIDLRDRFGITQITIGSEGAAHDVAAQVRNELCDPGDGHQCAARPPGGENPNFTTGAIEVIADSVMILNPSRQEPALLHQRFQRGCGRVSAAEIPVSGYPSPAHGAESDAAPQHRALHSRISLESGLSRDRDADPAQEHARRRARFYRAQPAASGRVLCPAPKPAAAQTTAHGRRHRTLFPDRALLPRRRPARRPPAGIHAA